MSLRISAFLLLSLSSTLSQNSFAAERVLYSFPSGVNQGAPRAPLVFDSVGNLYGTSTQGGQFGFGSVFMLVPSGGRYRERTIYSFTGGADGAFPYDKLTPDGAGNFFGTAQGGGIGMNGVVFELTPNSDGTWSETVLYTFTGGSDGSGPVGTVVFDSSGNLYGTAGAGGINNNGTVFELSPSAGGTWTETTLYSFLGRPDGSQPRSSLTLDNAGNLFGTTVYGGTANGGTIFELSPSGASWLETVVLNFSGTTGIFPSGALILDSAGNFYGTTQSGGTGHAGVVFELSPAGAFWNFFLLHEFTTAKGGSVLIGGVTLDGSGNVYGTTDNGGLQTFGTVYKLTPSSGTWAVHYLHSFTGAPDGSVPLAGVTLDSAGNIYGTTASGGANGTGAVFEIVP